MRRIVFLFSDLKMNVGGNIAQAKFADLCTQFTDTEIVTYGEQVANYRHLDDVLAQSATDSSKPMYVIHWGPHIPMLLERLRGQDVIYFAHSTGWGAHVPSNVPIFTVSRNTLGFWGRHAANSLLRYVPNIVESKPSSTEWDKRPVDVLIQKRKSSDYLLHQLAPALQGMFRVTIIDGWVESLAEELEKAKIYLYDSTEHWIAKGATEGFGLPPIEALAAGCIVFSSVNDALADYLDPGFNCHKLRTHSVEYDIEMIRRSLLTGEPRTDPTALLAQFSQSEVSSKLRTAFADAETFFVFSAGKESSIADAGTYAPAIGKRSLLKRLRRRAKGMLRGLHS